MIKRPLISIVMPAFNSARFICDAIDSVLNQTYQNWELLVIDDGSSDETGAILKKYGHLDGRIRVYTNTCNRGVSVARNRGISLARADWIAFLDSDDLWNEHKLEKQIELVQDGARKFIFSGSSFIDENGARYNSAMHVPATVDLERLLQQNIISCSSVLINRQCIPNYEIYDCKVHEDFVMWLRILKNGIIAYGIDEPLLIYRISRGSKTGNKLKSAIMTYNVYRLFNLSILESLYYMAFYVCRNVKKYNEIYSSGKEVRAQ